MKVLFLFASIYIWLRNAESQSLSQVQVVELDYHYDLQQNYFEIMPIQADQISLDFTICLRCKFWRLSNFIIVSSERIRIGLKECKGYFDIFGFYNFYIGGLKCFPISWNSFCIVHNQTNSSVTLALNDFSETHFVNASSFKMEDLKKTLKFGDYFLDSWILSEFSGQVADLNFWNKTLDTTAISDFMSGRLEKLFEQLVI